MIHCTDTPSTFDVTKSDLYQWHIVERGWSRFGYSMMWRRDGSTEWLIPFDRDDVIESWEISNGARGWNGKTKHFVYAGGKDNIDNRTDVQKIAMANDIKMITMLYPGIKWIGHNQVNANKYCPSFSVPDFCQEIGIKDKNIDFKTYYR